VGPEQGAGPALSAVRAPINQLHKRIPWSGGTSQKRSWRASPERVRISVDALLYGRVSYENHAEVWPTLEEAFGDYAVRMNTIPKHGASRTLTEMKWNATLLEGDVVDAVRKLKEQPGGDILKIGTSGSFSRTLLEHRLVDEYLFWLFPIIAGIGARLYDRDRYHGFDTTDFDLIDVKQLDNGILGLTYVPTTRQL
jgi:dihydrofolate reductase